MGDIPAYNAFPEAGVDALIDFMREFERRNGVAAARDFRRSAAPAGQRRVGAGPRNVPPSGQGAGRGGGVMSRQAVFQ